MKSYYRNISRLRRITVIVFPCKFSVQLAMSTYKFVSVSNINMIQQMHVYAVQHVSYELIRVYLLTNSSKQFVWIITLQVNIKLVHILCGDDY